MIKYTLLTSLVLALSPLVVHAKPFFPTLWGRANSKTLTAPRFVGTDSAPLPPAPLSRRELLSLLRGGDAPPPDDRQIGKEWVGGYIEKNPKLDYPQMNPDLLRGDDAPPPPDDRQNGKEWVGGYIEKKQNLDYPQTDPDLLRGGDAPPHPRDRQNGKEWVGGYIKKNRKLDYPQTNPDLNSVPMTGNHDNIDKLDRMMKVKYPEFSWLMDKGDTNSRRYVQFYDDISRIAYTNEGKVYSIICPQLGMDLGRFGMCGTCNVEVHVNSTRGWVDEDTRTVCADLTLEAIVWIDMNDKEKKKYPQRARIQEDLNNRGFPFSKDNGMRIAAHCPGKPYEKNCPLLNGTDSSYPVPLYAEHYESFSVAHIATKIRATTTGDERLDDCHEILSLLMEIGLPGMLSPGSIIDWNLWFEPPVPVNQTEWRDHAEEMRVSIKGHNTRTALGKQLVKVRDFDGNLVIKDSFWTMVSRKGPEIFKKTNAYIKKYHPELKYPKTVMVRYYLSHAFRHFFLSDKKNRKGNHLFRPFVYTLIDVLVEVGMLFLAFVCMEGPARIFIGTLVALHGLLAIFTNYGIEGRVLKNFPVFPVTYMINFDKILLISFVLNPFIFGEYLKYFWVKYISVIVGSISWFIILPRLDRDPSPTITVGYGSKQYMI